MQEASDFEGVYSLRDDTAAIEAMQRASLSDGPVGLHATDGLAGSEGWLKLAGGETSTWPCGIDPTSGRRFDRMRAMFHMRLPLLVQAHWKSGLDAIESG